MSTIALRLLDPKFQSVEKTQEFRSRRWSERNIFHKNRIFSKLIQISIAVEISNDFEFVFHRMDHNQKCIFIFYITVIGPKLADLKR